MALDGCNHLAHGRWWRRNRKTVTIKVRSERKEEPKWDEYTEAKIRDIGSELRKFARDLSDIKRAIEHRRGDHDVPESDFET